MDKMDLSNLISHTHSKKNEPLTERLPQVTPSESAPKPKETADYYSSGEESYGMKSREREREIVGKMIERLPEPDRNAAANIARIVSENSPNAFKALRAIIANRSGLDEYSPGSELLDLEKTLAAAESSPEPGKRVADVLHGVGLIPKDLKEKFLKAAEHMLTAEAAAFRRKPAPRHAEGAEAPPPPLPGEGEAPVAVDESSGVYRPKSAGFEMKVDFDLFFSVSSRYAVKQGEDASGSYYEASAEMAAKFEAGFSMEINGKFLELADMAEELDPKVLDAFSEAVKGLAGLDEDSLDRFFQATEALFSEIENDYGLEKGQLAGTVEGLKATAESFFNAVTASVEGALPGVAVDQIFDLPATLDKNGSTNLLAMMNRMLESGQRQGRAENAGKNSESLSKLMESLTAGENALGAGSIPGLGELTALLSQALPSLPTPADSYAPPVDLLTAA